MKLIGVVLLSGFTAFACSSGETQAPDPGQDGGSFEYCVVENYKDLIGQSVDEIDKTRLPSIYRIIHERGLKTEDYVPSRLNITYDDNRQIIEVSCG